MSCLLPRGVPVTDFTLRPLQIADLSCKVSELDSGVNRYQYEASEHKVMSSSRSLLEVVHVRMQSHHVSRSP